MHVVSLKVDANSTAVAREPRRHAGINMYGALLMTKELLQQ